MHSEMPTPTTGSLRRFVVKRKKFLAVSTMATGGPAFRRSSSVACDRDILQHRGSCPNLDRMTQTTMVTEEIQTEGEELFEAFLAEQIEREGLEPPENVREQVTRLQDNNDWVDQGSRLRVVADDFAQTQERQNVQQQANDMNLSSLNRETFQQMLREVFLGGHITRERIVVLFFFCSDVAIRVLREKSINLFNQLLSWIVDFIRNIVCRWVAEHGGWGAVLAGSFQILQLVISVLAFTVAGWSLYRWFRSR